MSALNLLVSSMLGYAYRSPSLLRGIKRAMFTHGTRITRPEISEDVKVLVSTHNGTTGKQNIFVKVAT